jgi:hypothetical protein
MPKKHPRELNVCFGGNNHPVPMSFIWQFWMPLNSFATWNNGFVPYSSSCTPILPGCWCCGPIMVTNVGSRVIACAKSTVVKSLKIESNNYRPLLFVIVTTIFVNVYRNVQEWAIYVIGMALSPPSSIHETTESLSARSQDREFSIVQ